MKVIVIGSGHNGLVCAALLAKEGFEVEVLEASETLGGASRTTEIIPGYRTSTASYSLSLFRPDVWESLGLGFRVRLIRKEPAVSVPYPDGRWLSLRSDAAATRASIETIHAPDADAYVRWNAFVEEAAAKIRPLIDARVPPSLDEARAALGDDMWRLCVENSAAETASAFFASDEMRGLIASQGIVGTSRSVDDAGTAWILAYHFFGGEVVGETGAWAYVVGGTGALSAAIADVARDNGATVRAGARVERIVTSETGSMAMLSSGRSGLKGRFRRGRQIPTFVVDGLQLADGTMIEADVVVSNAHPVTTFAMLGSGEEAVKDWDSSSRTFKVNLALRSLPELANDPRGDACNGTLSFTWGPEHLRATAASTGTSPDPWMEVFVGSAVDPSLVDGEGHTLSAFCQYAGDPFDPEEAARIVIASLDRAAPGLAEDVLGVQVLGPRDLEREIGLIGGNIFHGELAPPQIFANRFPARSDVQGLYLCGSGTHPGGALTGAPGRNAAEAILNRFSRVRRDGTRRIDRWGPKGPAQDSYSVDSDRDRFAPLHPWTEQLLEQLEAEYEVTRSETLDGSDRTVRLEPPEAAAPLTVTFTSYPGVRATFGHWYELFAPMCGCDACDEDEEEVFDDWNQALIAVISRGFQEQVTLGRGHAERRIDTASGSSANRVDEDAAQRMIAEAGGDRFEWEPWPRR